MNKDIKLGDYNSLKMIEEARRPDPHAYGGEEVFGIFLDGGREGKILMPKKYVPKGVKVGDSVDCFVYLDQEERLVATTEKPLAKVGDFAYLKCSWVNEYGAFLNWGLMKDVFCPFHEQKMRMQVGRGYIVYIYIDEDSYRIVATAKIDRFLKENEEETAQLKHGEEVDLLVWQKTDLGFKVIINNKLPGLVYENQVFRGLHTGDRVKGYIANVRTDGKVDVTLQPTGRQQTEAFSTKLLDYLKAHGGQCPFGDKSNAEDIKREFEVSKKTFKKAIGELYRKRLITLTDNGIALTVNS